MSDEDILEKDREFESIILFLNKRSNSGLYDLNLIDGMFILSRNRKVNRFVFVK